MTNLTDIYKIVHKNRGKAKEGFIRPTIGESFMSNKNFQEIVPEIVPEILPFEKVWTLDNPNAYDTSEGDQFGQSVAISETYTVVGAYYEDDAGGTNSGKAYIYKI